MEEDVKNQLDQLGNIIDEKIEKATGQALESANGKADESLKNEINNLTEKFNERFDKFEVENKKMFEKKNESKNFKTNLTKALTLDYLQNAIFTAKVGIGKTNPSTAVLTLAWRLRFFNCWNNISCASSEPGPE